MYQIKTVPEDFIVKEISKFNAKENGRYAYFLLKKTNYSTVRALEILSEILKIPLKNIGFAGNKDKNAVTEQAISIFRGSRNSERLNLKNIELKYFGNGKEPISLGDLEGNEFVITIRNINEDQIEKIRKLENKSTNVPNLFGTQRFSKNNHLVGKAIIKKDLRKAVELILENEGGIEIQMKDYLKNNKNDYAGALRLIPLKTRKLFVHSYQSLLFNKIANDYLKISIKNKNEEINNKNDKLNNQDKIKNIQIPIIGFNFEINSIKNKILKDIIKKAVEEEKINSRDFIISQMPELASEGTKRSLFFELNDLKILETCEDELNNGMKKIKISFILPKSCYATTLLEFIFQ